MQLTRLFWRSPRGLTLGIADMAALLSVAGALLACSYLSHDAFPATLAGAVGAGTWLGRAQFTLRAAGAAFPVIFALGVPSHRRVLHFRLGFMGAMAVCSALAAFDLHSDGSLVGVAYAAAAVPFGRAVIPELFVVDPTDYGRR